MPSTLEICAPFVVDKWLTLFNKLAHSASVCREWMWLDAHLLTSLLPYPQEKCIDACRYMIEKSLRVTDFKKLKKEILEKLCIDFIVLIPDGTDLLIEQLSVRVMDSEVSNSDESHIPGFICFANCSADVEQCFDWMAERSTDWKVGAFLVPCRCDDVDEYNMQRLMNIYLGLPEPYKELLMQAPFKWRFWLTHVHGSYSTNIDYLVNWVFAEPVDSLNEGGD